MPLNRYFYRRSLFATLALSLLTGCIFMGPEPDVLPVPEGTATPFTEPTPTPFSSEGQVSTPAPVSSTSSSVASSEDALPPLKWVTLENGDILSDSFKLNFGPGSKGFEFSPGSKGFDFGPGSKGFQGQNLRFDIRYPSTLTNTSLRPFTVQQSALEAFGGPRVQELVIEFIRDNQLYATATALPRRPVIEVPASFIPGEYQLSVILKTATQSQTLSWQRLTLTDNAQTVLRVDVFGNSDTRPEDLDVGVLTKTEPIEIVSATSSVEPEVTPTVVPTVSPTGTP